MKKALLLVVALVMTLSITACGTAVPRMERVPFEAMVVADTEEYKVTITDVSVSGRYGVTFLLENKGSDELGLSVEGYVNGLFFSLVDWEAEKKVAAPGEQVECYLEFLNYGEFSVGAMTNIELIVSPSVAKVMEGGGMWYNTIESYTVQIYPYGEENAAVYEYVPKESHRVLVDNEYMTLIYVGNTSMGDARLYLQNHTDKDVMLCAVDNRALLNGSVEGSVHFNMFTPPQAQTFGIVFAVWPGNEGDGTHKYIKTDTIGITAELIDISTQEAMYISDEITLSLSGVKVTE